MHGVEGWTGTGVSRTAGVMGSRMTNSEPLPGPSLSASSVPPWSRTTLRARVKPMPSPPAVRARPWSPCANISKARARIAGSRPIPVSWTRTTA